MKKSRKQIPSPALLIGIVFLALAVYGVTQYGNLTLFPEPLNRTVIIENFEFESQGASCSTGQDSTADAELSLDNLIVFSGGVITPNPCIGLTASYDVQTVDDQDMVTINLKQNAIAGACIECVGYVPFSGSFKLNSLNFEVDIVYNGEVLERFAAIA